MPAPDLLSIPQWPPAASSASLTAAQPQFASGITFGDPNSAFSGQQRTLSALVGDLATPGAMRGESAYASA